MTYSIIIPTKNEEASIDYLLNQVQALSDDILILDNASQDATLKIAQKYNIRIIPCLQNGKGYALRLGLTHAKHPIVVFMDADGSHSADDIPKLVEPILHNQADMVIGSRMLGGSDELFNNFKEVFRLIGNLLTTSIIRHLYQHPLTDCHNGFRAIKTDVAKDLHLQENRFSIEQEMVLKCLALGYRIQEIPSHEYKRKGGVSKLRSSKELFDFISSFIKILFWCAKNKKKHQQSREHQPPHISKITT